MRKLMRELDAQAIAATFINSTDWKSFSYSLSEVKPSRTVRKIGDGECLLFWWMKLRARPDALNKYFACEIPLFGLLCAIGLENSTLVSTGPVNNLPVK